METTREAMKKIILHLCADIGSDSRPYQLDDDYEVILVGKDIGVENFEPPENVQGVIANPPCTEFSTARSSGTYNNLYKGMFLVDHCLRIIKQCQPEWWVLENPATGALKKMMGKPKEVYQPWEFGTPWTKKTALWGNFNMPRKLFKKYDDVPKIKGLYQRKGRKKVGLWQLHKSAIKLVPEFSFAVDKIKTDADMRSLCSQFFAKSFKEVNK